MPANALAVEVMLETGLRVSDVLNLRTEQLKSTRLTVCECKTGKTRVVTLSRNLLDRLKRQAGCIYVLNRHKRHGNIEHVRLFGRTLREPLRL